MDAKKYFGLNKLDEKLEAYVDFDNGFYVELGANDGLTQSNTAYFEKNRNWRGVLIEPSPHRFLECFRNRGDRNVIHCNACVSFLYAEHFVEMTYANLMTVSHNLETDLQDKDRHIEVGLTHLRNQEVKFTYGAVAKTLTSILDESNAPKSIDFLSLDVEGAEIEVLKGTDFKKYHIEYLLIECRDFGKMKKYLAGHGYSYIDHLSHTDVLFKRNSHS